MSTSTEIERRYGKMFQDSNITKISKLVEQKVDRSELIFEIERIFQELTRIQQQMGAFAEPEKKGAVFKMQKSFFREVNEESVYEDSRLGE
jgi:hypothetical protein